MKYFGEDKGLLGLQSNLQKSVLVEEFLKKSLCLGLFDI